jgi:tripartite-type tricarboxylate transporter receptor subunit TctC
MRLHYWFHSALTVLVFYTFGIWGITNNSWSQSFPSHPIRVIVPFSAGAGADINARIASEGMSENLGQPVVVENITGATGNIGMERAAKAAPDGYTLFLASAINTSNYAARPESTQDLLSLFKPIGKIGDNAFALVVSPKSGIKSLDDLLALAKSKPGTLAYGSVGIGSSHHFVSEMFRSAASIDVIHIPYRGEGEVIGEVIAGRLAFSFVVTARPFLERNQLLALATTAPGPWPLLKDVPPLATLGFPRFEQTGWNGFMVNKATPDDIVTKLSQSLGKALKNEKLRVAQAATGFMPANGSPEEMTQQIQNDLQKFRQVINERKLKFTE